MSKKITNATIDKYINLNKKEEEIISLDYGTDGEIDFTVELRADLNIGLRSRFIDIITDTIIVNGNYHPEFMNDLIKIAFFECYVINIKNPMSKEFKDIVDTDKIIEIVDGLDLINRYLDNCKLDCFFNTKEKYINEKIKYEIELAKSSHIADKIFEKVLELSYGAFDKLEEALSDINMEEVNNIFETLMAQKEIESNEEKVEE